MQQQQPPTSTRRKKKQQLEQFNLIVAGQAHLGKTLFLRTLLQTLNVVSRGSPAGALGGGGGLGDEEVEGEWFPAGPTTSITSHTMVISEGRRRFALTLVDTPGFVDDGTVPQQCQLLLTFIENHFEMRLIEESRVKRDPKALHRQIHACVYFLDPLYSGIRPVDVVVLKELQRRVNVILALAKGDLLTTTRLKEVKRAVRADLRKHRLKVYTFPDYEFAEDEETVVVAAVAAEEEPDSAENYESGKILRSLVPFSIINMEIFSSTSAADLRQEGGGGEEEEGEDELYDYEMDNGNTALGEENDSPIATPKEPLKQETLDGSPGETTKEDGFLGREYPWGKVYITNPKHCDFTALRAALLISHRRTLREITVDALYEQYRTERMKERRASMLAAKRSLKRNSGNIGMVGNSEQVTAMTERIDG